MPDPIEKREARRSRAAHRCRAILKNVPIGIFVLQLRDLTDDRSLQVVAMNPAAESITGVRSAELIGRTINQAFPVLRRLNIPGFLAKVVRQKQIVEFPDFAYGDARTRQAVWRLKAFPLPDRCLGVSLEDVTARRALEKCFLEAQSLEVLGQMAGASAHDLKNILSAAEGFCDLALAGSNREQALANLRKATQEAKAIAQMLKDFVRRDSDSRQTIDLNKIVEESVQMTRPLVGGSIRVEFSPQLRPAWIVAEGREVRLLLMNLAANARDAMPNGGDLLISTSEFVLKEPARSFGLAVGAGKYVALCVQDTGMGMDEQVLSRIFEPFFTTKARGKGTGLGLCCVHRIVKRARGLILLNSALGKGTEFKILWPWVSKPPAERRLVRRYDHL